MESQPGTQNFVTAPFRLAIETSAYLNGTSADPRFLMSVQSSSAQSSVVIDLLPATQEPRPTEAESPLNAEDTRKEYYPFMEDVKLIDDLKKSR